MTEVPLKESVKLVITVGVKAWKEGKFCAQTCLFKKKIYKNHKRNMPQLQKVVVTYRHYAIIVYVPYQDRVKTT